MLILFGVLFQRFVEEARSRGEGVLVDEEGMNGRSLFPSNDEFEHGALRQLHSLVGLVKEQQCTPAP
jgi:hypothetical protein